MFTSILASINWASTTTHYQRLFRMSARVEQYCKCNWRARAGQGLITGLAGPRAARPNPQPGRADS
eukprot:15251844-Alexandrium_andersonii.AAC.1